MFLPTTREEMDRLGWKELDIILISGDTYIDSSYIGVAVIGRVLKERGYRVGIIAQPDINSDKDISRLGEPKLFWGVTSGAVDSMVANYTATKKKRRQDDFTPGGENTKRPDRATIAYSNLIKKNFKNTVPIVLGGIEASLRRIAHYDFWSNRIRKSILFDAKADILVYGMGEKTIVELANAYRDGEWVENIKGIAYISKEIRDDYIELPSFEEVKESKDKFIDMFNLFYINCDPLNADGLCQKQDTRYLIQNPPADYLSEMELDEVYGFDYERDVHPYYKKDGEVRAMETIKNSITSHRGCYGECNFCAIAIHQGRTIRGRSEKSILREGEKLASSKGFKGYISDVGGATANMYGIECEKKLKFGACKEKRCLYPTKCKAMKISHKKQTSLLKKMRNISGVKKVFVASGIRYDLIMDDKQNGMEYLKEIVDHHVSGQMKIAPEHSEDKVLSYMGKPGKEPLVKFRDKFYELNKQSGQKQFLTYYLIAAHPGCSDQEMDSLKKFASKDLKINPQQVQVFTPTPSTYSTLMYYTEMDPFTKKKIFVEKDVNRKIKQKDRLVGNFNKRR